MSARHLWSIVCEKVLVEPSAQTVSLIEVAEGLMAAGLSGQKSYVEVEICVVSAWFRSRTEPEVGATRFRIVAPDGDELDRSADLKIDLSAHTRAITVGRIHHLPVTGTGVYEFVVEQRRGSKWERCASVPLEITSA